MYIKLLLLVLLAVVSVGAQARRGASNELIWHDEFNGRLNEPLSPSLWAYDLGGGGWGNHELETYTQVPEMSFKTAKGTL